MKKYVSNGGYAFRDFFKKHTRTVDETSRKESESIWMVRIRKCMQVENVSFEEEFRRFPIDCGRQYVPKFVLNDVSYGARHVVIDMCETRPTKDNTAEIRSFVSKYGTQYYVVLVVHDGHLREWNECNRDRHTFDDIWTSDSISELVNYLQSIAERGGRGYVQKEFVRCEPPDGCGKTASGHNEVETVFGYRKNSDGQMTAHLYCRKCRRKTNRGEAGEIPDDWEAKNTYCTGCRSTFVPTSPSQSHCRSCLQEFRGCSE